MLHFILYSVITLGLLRNCHAVQVEELVPSVCLGCRRFVLVKSAKLQLNNYKSTDYSRW
jgi:hypothetical protein